jgi:hypothetical protein
VLEADGLRRDDPIAPIIEITLSGANVTPDENARQIVAYLEEQGYLHSQIN